MSNEIKKNEEYRTLGLRLSSDGVPKTINEEKRSVEVIASTESPVQVFDYERWEVVNEVLLMSGCNMPESRQVPLLDTHSRYSSSSVIGSLRNMATSKGELTGRAFFSGVDDVSDTWTKVREGHLTDFSVGYIVRAATWLDEGQKAVIDGREFEGPLKVVTDWKVRELSVCPIGADENAKARAKAQPEHKEKTVDKKLRAFLERQGLAQDANEEQAYQFLEKLEVKKEETPPVVPPAKDPVIDPEETKRATAKAVRAERVRISEITAMGARFGCEELATTLIDGDNTLDEARKAIMDHLAKEDKSPGHRSPVEIGTEDREKFRAAATDAVMVRAGVQIKELAAGADELAGRSMVEMARMALTRSGHRDGGRPLDVVGRALTTSDFPYILASAANKSLNVGFETANETWSTWCATGSVSDFKTQSAVRASETSDLDEVPESTEYKYGDRSESREQYAIATYGKLLAITRQSIINDDLGALSDIPAAHGEAAARKIGDIVYAVLTANAAMGDGTALFASGHSNVGTTGAPGITTLAEGIKLMKLQTDIKGLRRLNIRPEFFIAPVAYEGAAEVMFKSEFYDGAGNKAATTVNPYYGDYFTRVYDPRLDDNSTAKWYMAGPKGKTVKVFFLDGVQTPYMETKQGWSVDGVEYKVRIDAGAKAMDWRALVYNAGS